MHFSRSQPVCDVGSKYYHCKDILNFVFAHLSVILAEEVTCFLGLCLPSFWVLWLLWAPPCPAGIHAHTLWLLVGGTAVGGDRGIREMMSLLP